MKGIKGEGGEKGKERAADKMIGSRGRGMKHRASGTGWEVSDEARRACYETAKGCIPTRLLGFIWKCELTAEDN